MEIVAGIVGVLIMIIIGMFFRRMMALVWLILEGIVKLIKKLF